MPKRICVVGAGVSGLTAAITLSKAGHDVTVVAKDQGERTTSSIAAAFWYPFWTGDKPDHSWYKREWAEITYEVLSHLLNVPGAGISRTGLYEYYPHVMTDAEIDEIIESMWWLSPKTEYRPLLPDELTNRSLRGYRFNRGIYFKTFVVNMPDYLRYLAESLREFQKEPTEQIVQNLAELATEYDFVVNCSGIGAQPLVPDYGVKAREGVVLQFTPCPTINDIFLIHTGPYFEVRPLYIVPRSGKETDLILGGSITEAFREAERRAYQAQHIPADDIPEWAMEVVARIQSDCIEFAPELSTCKLKKVQVGYRPSRHEARLALEGNIIHNYGHGGGGVTLSWGCAEEVLQLIN